LILVTTNSRSFDVPVTYDLSMFDAVDCLVTAYRTSADEDLAQLPPAHVVDGVFASPAKAGSVTTYVFMGVTYTGPIGFDARTYYKLVNVNSGLLLDVSGASLYDGAQLIQWPDNGGWNQQWLIPGLGGGAYNLVNRNSGLILDVSNASPDDGANIVQFHDHDASNQKWSLLDLGDGTFQVLNGNSTLLADVVNASTDAGARIIQYHDDASASQRWMLVPAQ